MAQKRLNNVLPGVKRPLRVEDLQAVWDGLNEALAIGTTGAPRILWGFNDKGDGTLSAGIVAFNEKLYVHEDTADSRIRLGEVAYAHEVSSGDLRIFADASEQVFSYNRIVSNIKTGGVAIGTFSIANIDTWKSAYIGAEKITATQILNRTITSGKLALSSITANELASNSVTRSEITPGEVTSEKFEDGWLNAYQPFGVIFKVPTDASSGTATTSTSSGSGKPFYANEVFEPTGEVTFDTATRKGKVVIWVKGGEASVNIPRDIAIPTVSVSALNMSSASNVVSTVTFDLAWIYTFSSHISRQLIIYFEVAAGVGEIEFAINGWVSRTPYIPGGAV